MSEYTVWGGYEGTSGDHWATFPTLAQAKRYVARCLRKNSKLILHIKEEGRSQG